MAREASFGHIAAKPLAESIRNLDLEAAAVTAAINIAMLIN